MYLSVLFTLAIQLIKAQSIEAYPAVTENELICPDSNPINCYPKLFVPSDEWQIVKEGQIVPVGLDIKMDFETSERKAKLINKMENGEQIQKGKKNDLALLDNEPGFQNSLNYVTELFFNNKIPDLDYNSIVEHLEILVEWSSDLESGEAIIQQIQPFLKLSGLYSERIEESFGLTYKQYTRVQEMVYRILSSALRNNREAQENLVNYLRFPEDFLMKLIYVDESDIRHGNFLVLNRKLGVLGALINNRVFEYECKKFHIDNELFKLYSKIDDINVKSKIVNILEDFKLQKRDDLEPSADISGAEDLDDSIFAKLLQDKLIGSQLNSDDDAKQLLNSLKDLKLSNPKSFRATPSFLEWLNTQIEKERKLKVDKKGKRDSVTRRYLDELIEMRHQVFGNPLASRKEYLDEL